MKKKVLTLFVLFIIAISLQSFSMIKEAPVDGGCVTDGSCTITRPDGTIIKSTGSFIE